MYTRFYNSIISPKNIVDFRKDSLFKVFFYILFFAVLLSTRITIDTITYDGLDESAKETMIQEFNNVNDTCIITNSVLECGDAESTLVYQDLLVGFYTDSFDNFNASVYKENGYNVVFHDESVHLVVAGTDIFIMPISELPSDLHNFTLSTQESDPNYFYDVIFDSVDELMINSVNVWGIGMIVLDFLTNFMMFMIFILLSSWMLRIRFKQLKFKHLFTMTAYSSTALYLILIINSLYDLNFFVIFLLLIVAIRQNSQLSMELYKRLGKKS